MVTKCLLSEALIGQKSQRGPLSGEDYRAPIMRGEHCMQIMWFHKTKAAGSDRLLL